MVGFVIVKHYPRLGFRILFLIFNSFEEFNKIKFVSWMPKSKNWLLQSTTNRSVDCDTLTLRIYVYFDWLSWLLPCFRSSGPRIECCLISIDYWLLVFQNLIQLFRKFESLSINHCALLKFWSVNYLRSRILDATCQKHCSKLRGVWLGAKSALNQKAAPLEG